MSISTTNLDLEVNKCIGLEQIRTRLASKIADSYNNNRNVLIESLPITGKSYSTFKQASETNTNILYLTSLNRLKDKAEKKCKDNNLKCYRIPTPHDECPSFKSEQYGKELRELYRKGISAKELHDRLDLPCSDSCPYLDKLNKDISDNDVLIGNPKHAYNNKYLENRIVVKDEFSEGEYEIEYFNPRELINRFLNSVTNLPFGSYTEILKERDTDKAKEARQWFEKHDIYRDTETALQPEEYHVHAPLLTFALIFPSWSVNEWERTDIGLTEVFGVESSISGNAQVVFNPKKENMYLLNPPEFSSADGFIGLDGTPIPEMWGIATGLDLEHIQILNDREKQHYITDILNLEIKELTDSKRYYQSSDNIAVNQDTTYSYSIKETEKEKPGLVTSKKALQQYDSEITDYIDESLNFAKVLSSNKFKDKQLGFVTGMRNYGDEYILKWGCYLNKDVSIDRSSKDTNIQFGNESFDVFPLYRNLTLQDVLRFGRNTEQTTVYVNTSGLPSWVPTRKVDLQVHNSGERQIISFLEEKGSMGGNTTEITKNTDMSKRNAQIIMNRLKNKGIVEKHTFDSAPIYTLNN